MCLFYLHYYYYKNSHNFLFEVVLFFDKEK